MSLAWSSLTPCPCWCVAGARSASRPQFLLNTQRNQAHWYHARGIPSKSGAFGLPSFSKRNKQKRSPATSRFVAQPTTALHQIEKEFQRQIRQRSMHVSFQGTGLIVVTSKANGQKTFRAKQHVSCRLRVSDSDRCDKPGHNELASPGCLNSK